MTKEAAARILDPATTVEALAEIEYYAGFSGQIAKIQACSAACEIAAAVLRESAAKDTNVLTHGDRFRAMTDTEYADGLYRLFLLTAEQDGGNVSEHWCDGKDCYLEDEDEFICNEERHKACILRWLRSPADSKEEPYETKTND